jgi:hypothetical protein
LAKLKLGIYYFRKSVSRFSEDNQMGGILKRSLGMASPPSAMPKGFAFEPATLSNVTLRVLERKNRKRRFFLSKSMPNFNFAEVQLRRLPVGPSDDFQ